MLDKYRDFLDQHTYLGEDVTKYYGRIPLSRYYTLRKAIELFKENSGSVAVELGTVRSFVHGGHPGCNSSDDSYWHPNNPEDWDWGAGCFSRVMAECLEEDSVEVHTVDISGEHIRRCRLVTSEYKSKFSYHVMNSVAFLAGFKKKIDLVYIDTGDMTPIEPTAQHQLKEAQAIVEHGVLSDNGVVLIDDVRNSTPIQFGEDSRLGKAKYSIPFLLENGFECVMDEYQVLMKLVR